MQEENVHWWCQPVGLSFGFESLSGWKHFWCKYEEFSDGKSKFFTCFKIWFLTCFKMWFLTYFKILFLTYLDMWFIICFKIWFLRCFKIWFLACFKISFAFSISKGLTDPEHRFRKRLSFSMEVSNIYADNSKYTRYIFSSISFWLFHVLRLKHS